MTSAHQRSARERLSPARRLLGRLAAAAGLTVLILYLARAPVLTAMARLLTVNDAVAPADYLVVLGGGPETRPFTAAALYRSGMAPSVLLFTDGSPSTSDAARALELNRRVLERQGVPDSVIQVLPGGVRSSIDEALSLRRWLTSHPARSVVLVTSPEHGWRARWTFATALQDLPVEVRIAASYHREFDETDWWTTDAGVLTYLHEFLKLPLYRVRHFMGRGLHGDLQAGGTS